MVVLVFLQFGSLLFLLLLCYRATGIFALGDRSYRTTDVCMHACTGWDLAHYGVEFGVRVIWAMDFWLWGVLGGRICRFHFILLLGRMGWNIGTTGRIRYRTDTYGMFYEGDVIVLRCFIYLGIGVVNTEYLSIICLLPGLLGCDTKGLE